MWCLLRVKAALVIANFKVEAVEMKSMLWMLGSPTNSLRTDKTGLGKALLGADKILAMP